MSPFRSMHSHCARCIRTGPSAGANFCPGEDTKEMLHSMIKVLVIGAGGLGCELLKDLALLGFLNLEVIDMDTIEVSESLNHFLPFPS